MATQIRKLMLGWLEWRLATARLRVVSMNAAEPTAPATRDRSTTERISPLPGGNLCPGRAV